MVKLIRVLLLCDHAFVLEDLRRHCDLDVVQHGQTIEGVRPYPRATDALRADIARLTAEDPPFDLIVIGNNMGTGLGRAEAIPDVMKDKTIIVWNASSDQDGRDKYEKMGFPHFGVRNDDLTQDFLRILGVAE